MSSKKPPASSSMPMEEQDRSIRARKNQLFDDSNHDLPTISKRPFADYLKTTPGAPPTQGQKTAFWSIAAVVILLFLAAILGRRR